MTIAEKHAEIRQDVASIEDFVSYLRLLVGECRGALAVDQLLDAAVLYKRGPRMDDLDCS